MTFCNLFVEAGFQSVFVGIESPDEDSPLRMRQNTEHEHRPYRQYSEASVLPGLQVQGGFIVGFDSDKSTIFGDMARFINESGIVTSMVGLLNALPGTELYQRLKRENRIIKSESGDNTNFTYEFQTGNGL